MQLRPDLLAAKSAVSAALINSMGVSKWGFPLRQVATPMEADTPTSELSSVL